MPRRPGPPREGQSIEENMASNTELNIQGLVEQFRGDVDGLKGLIESYSGHGDEQSQHQVIEFTEALRRIEAGE